MSDAFAGLSLDHETVSAQATVARDRDPWLERRRFGWGASEVASLLLAYDPRADEERTARRYHLQDAERTKRGGGLPRIVARKAGLLAAKGSSRVMREGARRERELLDAWAKDSAYERVQHSDDAPREWYPLVDRACPILTATPDGWCRGPSGELITIEAKCTADYPPGLAWFWRVQLQAQIAAVAAAAGILVCGPGWVMGADTQPISWVVERNDGEIARIRFVCELAWRDVQRVRV